MINGRIHAVYLAFTQYVLLVKCEEIKKAEMAVGCPYSANHDGYI